MHMQRNIPASTSRRGFTIIEILVVVAVIVLLASIAVAVGVAMKRGAQEKYTRSTMETLAGTMSIYLKDHPEPNDTTWVNSLQATQDGAAALANLNKSGSAGAQQILDGWGNQIHYIPSDPANGKPTAFFWSYGPNGQTGTVPPTDYSKDDIFSSGVAPAP